MAEVLILATTEDAARAGELAAVLRRAGMSLSPWKPELEAQTACTVVIWSDAAARVPALVEAAGRAPMALVARIGAGGMPPSLQRLPTFDLAGWTGEPDAAILDPLFFAIDRAVADQRRSRAPVPAASPNLAEIARAWGTIKDSRDPAAFQAFLQTFGQDHDFAELARMRLERLTRDGVTIPSTAPVPAMGLPYGRGPSPAQPSAPPAPPAPTRAPTGFDNWSTGMRPAPVAPAPVAPPPPAPPAPVYQQAPGYQQAPSYQPAPTVPPPMARPAPAPMPAPAPAAPAPQQYRPADFGLPDLSSTTGAPRPGLGPIAEPPPKRKGGMAVVVMSALLAAAGGYAWYMQSSGTLPTADQAAAPAPASANGPGRAAGTSDSDLAAAETLPAPTADDEQTLAESQDPLDPAPVAQARTTRPAPRDEGIGGPVTSPSQQLSQAARPAVAPMVEFPSAPLTGIGPQVSIGSLSSGTPPTRFERVRGQVTWAARPEGSALAAAYPQRAINSGANGVVQLRCWIQTDLRPSCQVASEQPRNMGFGQAALTLSQRFRAQPELSDGSPAVGSEAQIYLRFNGAQ